MFETKTDEVLFAVNIGRFFEMGKMITRDMTTQDVWNMFMIFVNATGENCSGKKLGDIARSFADSMNENFVAQADSED